MGQDPRIGTLLGKFKIKAVLGRGGMGVVYKGQDEDLDPPVALKMILTGVHAAPEDMTRFREESRAVASLQHPNIVQIYHTDVAEDGCPYLVLEYVDGSSLAVWMAQTPQPARPAAELVEVIAQAVEYAQQRGIIHRDLKPANVLLTADGIPKLTDFGLAKNLVKGAGQTQSGAVLGTPSYMAPEQAEGRAREVGPAADVWALGATLYELLTGQPPFRGATREDTLEQVRTQELVPPSRLQPNTPRDLETICLKCLEKKPKQRYACAADLAADLRRFLDGGAIQARPVSAAGQVWRWCKQRPRNAAILAMAGVLLPVPLVGLLSEPARPWWGAETPEGKLSEADAFRYLQEQGGRAWRDQGMKQEILTPADLPALAITLPPGNEAVAGILQRLTGFPQLKTINAAQAGHSDNDLKHLLKARKLEDLYLAGRGITDAGLDRPPPCRDRGTCGRRTRRQRRGRSSRWGCPPVEAELFGHFDVVAQGRVRRRGVQEGHLAEQTGEPMHESTLLDYCSVPHGPCWRVGNSLRELPCTRGASALPEPGGTP